MRANQGNSVPKQVRFSTAPRVAIWKTRNIRGWLRHSGLLLFVLLCVGCSGDYGTVGDDDESVSPEVTDNGGNATSSEVQASQDGDYGENLLIGSYNIQVFGQSKLQNQPVMDYLAEIALRFDVLAIQEIRSAQQDVLPRYVAIINAYGAKFSYIIGPRLGRTTSKEQYAFVYDSERLEPIGTPFTVPDPNDVLHREPFVARFRVRSNDPDNAFTFALINIHTDPDETDIELNVLDDVYRYVRKQLPEEDDVILLGDLNVNERKLGELGQVPGIGYVIANQATNTRGTATYDNILFDQMSTQEFTGRSGVFRVDREYGLTIEQTLQISDHFPIWAEFSARESSSRLASGNRTTR